MGTYRRDIVYRFSTATDHLHHASIVSDNERREGKKLADTRKKREEDTEAGAGVCLLILIMALLLILKVSDFVISQQAQAASFSFGSGTPPLSLAHSLITHSLIDSGTLEPY